MKKALLTMLAAVGLTALAAVPAKACTSYYVGSGLTEDGSTLFGRTEDIGNYHSKVFDVIDSKKISEGEKWVDEDGGTAFTAPYKDGLTETYRYTACRDGAKGDGLFGEVGVNEMGVSMSATTTAGNSEEAEAADPFVGKTGISEENYVDYVLCQAKTAREGVEILANAIDECGVWYSADGVFISDQNEVWYMEILSGYQYCAIKMPDDEAAIIPNCLVIGDIDITDANKANSDLIVSDNIINKAIEGEIYQPSLTDPDNKNALNVKLTYGGKGYASGNADRIRAGKYILTGEDNTAIYTDEYQDIFFTIPSDKAVTVEKLYQLAGSQYEEYDAAEIDFQDARTKAGITNSVRVIGANGSQECHILQVNQKEADKDTVPAQLATVEWLSMSSAAYSPMVPFYGALLTDVAEPYKVAELTMADDPQSAYGICKAMNNLMRDEDAKPFVKKTVKKIFKDYVGKLEDKQKTVNEDLMNISNQEDISKLQEEATKLGISIGNQTLDMVKQLYAEVKEVMPPEDFTNGDDIEYEVPETPSTQQPQATEPQAQTVSAPAKTVIKKLKNRKGKKLQVKFKKVSGADGYEIAYSKGVNFGKKKTTVKSYNAAKNVRTIKKLKKGKRYFVKVRAYKMNGTQKVYGKWSQVKVVKIKK